jgi:hypothetical protein
MKSLIVRLSHLDQLIYLKSTGTPASLSRKIGLSERSIFDYLKLMKELGAPIHYSRARSSYYYRSGGRFNIRFVEGT